MTQYSSGKHETLTADPQPWLNVNSRGGRWSNEARDTENDVFRPRREYTRPLTNPANPILTQLRGEHALWEAHQDIYPYHDLSWRARSMLNSLRRGWEDYFTADEVDHARAVLYRVARLSPVEVFPGRGTCAHPADALTWTHKTPDGIVAILDGLLHATCDLCGLAVVMRVDTEECGDFPAPCNHDPAHGKREQ